MPGKLLNKLQNDPVIQFSVFVENKVGRLLDIIKLVESHNTHVLALTTIDTTDSAITRIVVDDPDCTRRLFLENAIAYTEADILAVELPATTDLEKVLSALLMVETNIHYTYAFIFRPNSASALAISVDDLEMAATGLSQQGFKVLHQKDISR